MTYIFLKLQHFPLTELTNSNKNVAYETHFITEWNSTVLAHRLIYRMHLGTGQLFPYARPFTGPEAHPGTGQAYF